MTHDLLIVHECTFLRFVDGGEAEYLTVSLTWVGILGDRSWEDGELFSPSRYLDDQHGCYERNGLTRYLEESHTVQDRTQDV